MYKEIIKRLISEKQTEIASIELVRRPMELESTSNYVFVGLRRAGKSYMMYQYIQDMIRAERISMAEDVDFFLYRLTKIYA